MNQQRRVPRAYANAAAAAPDRVCAGQYVADPQSDDVVVFLVGMRINRLRRLHSWWPTFVGMPRMLRELQACGPGTARRAHAFRAGRTFLVVQYWRSAEELGRYTRDASLSHAPVWAAFNKRVAATGDVGIFHETYVVPRDGIESRYGNMPLFGLGAAHGLLARGRSSARTAANRRLATTEPAYVHTAS